ncbi:MAG: serine hydrolase domain-containing protein [Methyloceanibacter sp.]|uniref:serine hydrolase domain-containing protein n=1 Tax=Methyloceanibacter sp. TaxID=1965321 RepID=UPI003D6DA489
MTSSNLWRPVACVLPALLGCAMVGALAAGAAPVAPQCPAGQIAAAGQCVTVEEAQARIEEIARKAMPKFKLKAVLAGFAVDGAAPTTMAWGDSMTGVPATPDMHFRNGAVAIAYIATVLLQLHDKGVIEVDDRLAKWFPDYPKADRVTLKMLINGTSGYADYVTDDEFLKQFYADPFRHWTPDELIAIGLDRPMICDPGTCWSYAHTNFVILGKVLEKASGRQLAELIREGILDPLTLKDTRSEETAIIQEPVLHAFDAERGKYEESTYWNPSWTLAQGAIMTSNISDILKSASAIGEGTLVSPESHALQLAPETAKFKPWSDTTYYALGIFLINGWIFQNPSFAGYAATMAYLPSHKLALAVSVTMEEEASLEGNFSTDVLKDIAAYLAPDAPF